MATILYESRLGCLGNSIPQLTADYIEALALMFCTFKTSMYAGAIPRWLRLLIPNPGRNSAGPGMDSSNSVREEWGHLLWSRVGQTSPLLVCLTLTQTVGSLQGMPW